jgi:hypothetical protein
VSDVHDVIGVLSRQGERQVRLQCDPNPPYFPDVKDAPQNSIIGGASLWVMSGKTPEEYKGITQNSSPSCRTPIVRSSARGVGYLPITRTAYEKPRPRASTGDPISKSAEGIDQQAADREFARPALRRHGAGA